MTKQWDTVAIVGVGLIGGSIGLALKENRLARRVVGIGRRRSSLQRARRRGAVDVTSQQLEQAAADADLVVFCTPVQLIVDQVRRVARRCRSGSVLTDAGSAKATIVGQLERNLPDGAAFVGSHPLAGSERRGVDWATPDLFRGRVCVVTETAYTPERALREVRAFWRRLGARVLVMSPEAHDRALARTSHLPHLVAAALASSLSPRLRPLAASGFRDTTRIAAGDPELWTGIFQQNRQPILDALDGFEKQLTLYRRALQRDDSGALRRLLARAQRQRASLDDGDGNGE